MLRAGRLAGYLAAPPLLLPAAAPRPCRYGIGFSVGLLNGLLSAAGVPYHRVHASTWKAAVGLRRQGKEGSLALARHLLPAAAGLLK